MLEDKCVVRRWPLLQVMLRSRSLSHFHSEWGAVLNLEQGQVTFNKLGVTLNLEESATGHSVIDLVSGRAGSITDESTLENASGSGKRSRNESGKDSEDTAETREFSNLICGSEKVTVIDVSKPRVSPVGWIVKNLAADGRLEIL